MDGGKSALGKPLPPESVFDKASLTAAASRIEE
jgi:hypothetical protein